MENKALRETAADYERVKRAFGPEEAERVIETQKMLHRLLWDRYKTILYYGSADHTAIRQFKQDGEILISTDNGARGFNLEEAAFVIHYDLPYNTLKMEQRIDRCHRLGQENDVLSLAFINQHNLADVRKLELASKRMLLKILSRGNVRFLYSICRCPFFFRIWMLRRCQVVVGGRY